MSMTRRSVLVGFGLLAFAPLRAVAETKAVAVGSVESAIGECMRRRPGGEKTQLVPGATIFIDDIVLTGADARLSLILGKATRLVLDGRARVHIDQFLVDRGGLLELHEGDFRLNNPSAFPAGTFKMTVRPM